MDLILSLGLIFMLEIGVWIMCFPPPLSLVLSYLVVISFVMPLSRIADAEENLGESEVREAHLAKSLFYIQIGDKVDKYYEFLFSLVLPFAIISFLSACNFHI